MNKIIPNMPDEILELVEEYVGPFRIYRGDIITMINKLTNEYEKIDLYYRNRKQINKWTKGHSRSSLWCYSLLKNDRIKPPPGTGLYEANPLLGKQWRRFHWFYAVQFAGAHSLLCDQLGVSQADSKVKSIAERLKAIVNI